MSESTQQEIERLMTEGLDRYAMGEDAEAMECWRRVLTLDPEHAEAQDYLRTAGEDVEETAPAAPAPAAASDSPSIVADGLALLRAGELDAALEALEAVTRVQPANLEAHAWIELARCELLQGYRQRLCDGIAVPQLCAAPEEIGKFNLPPAASALLATVDGGTSVNEMLEMTGTDPFETLRTCCRLLDAGIIEVHP